MTWLTVTLNNDNECYHVILCTSGEDEYCKMHCNIIAILAFEKVLQLVYQYFFSAQYCYYYCFYCFANCFVNYFANCPIIHLLLLVLVTSKQTSGLVGVSTSLVK